MAFGTMLACPYAGMATTLPGLLLCPTLPPMAIRPVRIVLLLLVADEVGNQEEQEVWDAGENADKHKNYA